MNCAICLEEINSNNVIYLECDHFFHKCCLYKIKSSYCPLCRTYISDINSILNGCYESNDETHRFNTSMLICCASRCPNGYSPFYKGGECRYCYGKNIPDCV